MRSHALSVTAALAAALSVSLLAFGVASAKSGAVPRAPTLAPLTLGFSSGADVVLASGSAATQAQWVPRAQRVGAQMVRLGVSWSQVAPSVPAAGFNASNPADPGYNWTTVDEQVRELTAAHFKILITIIGAPSWAEGANMPRSVSPGTWRPNAADFRQFARAIATRYDGHFPDPLKPGASLPRVSYWQAWDEPNLPEELTPQWTGSRARGYRAVSPGIYRNLENAFYAAVTAVSRSNYVVLAGLAPYGDSPSTSPMARMHPVDFERDLLCLTARLERVRGCAPTYFDAIDSHPYGIYGPNWHAFLIGDVAVPDVYKLVRVLEAARKAGTALPHAAKGDWVTETSWDSDPPDPHGVPIERQARWMEQEFYNLWKQGVRTVLWWQLVDSPPIPNYATTYQAGVYYLSGRAKPSATAFRFPFISWRSNHRTVTTWSRSPAAGTVAIQQRAGRGWRTIARRRVAADQVIEVPLQLSSRQTLRATIGRYASLPWTQAD